MTFIDETVAQAIADIEAAVQSLEDRQGPCHQVARSVCQISRIVWFSISKTISWAFSMLKGPVCHLVQRVAGICAWIYRWISGLFAVSDKPRKRRRLISLRLVIVIDDSYRSISNKKNLILKPL